MDANTSVIQPTFLFDDRKRFDAECEHDKLRSSLQSEIDLPPTADPWKQRPVDFTMKNFHPNRKKNKNSSLSTIENSSLKEKQFQNTQNETLDVMRPFQVAYQTKTNKFKNHHEFDDSQRFVTDPRIKYEKVKRMLNTETYKNPKLHDFREYPSIKELGLSEFQTSYGRDPYNIRFLSDHLNTLWLQARDNERITLVENPPPQMYRALTARPNWESKLVLPKLVFPNKYAAYTRYRNPTRTVQSAYWQRVEDHFGQRPEKRINVS